jgi:hypothetical protein
VDCDNRSDHCDDPDCLVCLHRDSLVATYDDLPGWMFVLTDVTGGACEIVVYDRDRRRRLEATGDDTDVLFGDLRIRALQLHRLSERGLPVAFETQAWSKKPAWG